jgi:hypothetical protein
VCQSNSHTSCPTGWRPYIASGFVVESSTGNFAASVQAATSGTVDGYNQFVVPSGTCYGGSATASIAVPSAASPLNDICVKFTCGTAASCQFSTQLVLSCQIQCTTTNTASSTDSTCTCKAGWTGAFCDTAVANPCAGNTCGGGGTCSPASGAAVCSCNTGYTGTGTTTCTAVVDACAGNTCGGGGTCSSASDAAVCTCNTGYTSSGGSCIVAKASSAVMNTHMSLVAAGLTIVTGVAVSIIQYSL